MMNLAQAFRCMILSLILASVPMLGGCANVGSWKEEVKLLDGRVINITQKRRYDNVFTGSNYGALPREYWLIFKLPEFGNQEITWHENLLPQVLNVYQGKLYVVGLPFTKVEFKQYGRLTHHISDIDMKRGNGCVFRSMKSLSKSMTPICSFPMNRLMERNL